MTKAEYIHKKLQLDSKIAMIKIMYEVFDSIPHWPTSEELTAKAAIGKALKKAESELAGLEVSMQVP